MTMYDIIQHKREGRALSDEQIAFWIDGVTCETIPDYQTAALLMAICLRGMTDAETATLTRRMAESGDMVDLSALGDRTVDKHSSGGVGDKTTFLAAPIAAAAGCVVAKMSGRGLGHTGGTIDKLESISGLQTTLSTDRFLQLARQNGFVLAGQSGNLAPADKKLYALRDVTATVASIPLIASSIMSKKLASGSKSIVLDVKVGSGAFMKSVAEAEALARAMMAIGTACGRRVTAVLSNMDAPLGDRIGNALEVMEAATVLQHPTPCDLLEVSLTLATEMIALSLQIPTPQAKEKAEQALYSGAAFRRFCDMVEAQGGDSAYLTDPTRFPPAEATLEVLAPTDGYVRQMDAEKIGLAAVQLGAGRLTKGALIDPAAGIQLHKKTGAPVTAGEPIATLYAKDKALCEAAACLYLSAVTIGAKPEPTSAILKILRGEGISVVEG